MKITSVVISNVVMFLLIWVNAGSSKLPSYVNLCKRNDPDIGKCMRNTINELRPYLIEGIREMEIPAIDPLHVSMISVDTGNAGGAVGVKAELSGLVIYGSKDFVLESFAANVNNARFSMVMKFPALHLTSAYKLKGKILMIPIDSTGLSESNITNIVATGEWYGKIIQKNGNDHIVFDRTDIRSVAETINVQFNNLFGDDEALTDQINRLLNENAQSFAPDLNPIVDELIGNLIKQIFNNVFGRYSLDELFPLE